MLIWLVDYKTINKYLDRWLIAFIIFGLYYVIISVVGGFSLFYKTPYEIIYVPRHSYFLPFILFAIPVFTESFSHGIFSFVLKSKIKNIYFPFLFYGSSLFYGIVILFSIKNYFLALIIFITSVIIGGGLSSSFQFALFQLILINIFIVRLKVNIKYIVLLIFPIIISVYFIPNDILQILYLFDTNAAWRLTFWVNSVRSTINDTLLIGHGFGTSYFDISARNQSDLLFIRIPDLTLAQYTRPEIVQFILAQHNSFLNIFYRLGLIGLFIFSGYIISISQRIKKLNLPYQLHYILLVGMILIGVNVGLENPRFLTEFIILFSLVNHYISEYTFSIKNTILKESF